MPTVKISALPTLAEGPASTDKLIINDGTVTKNVAYSTLMPVTDARSYGADPTGTNDSSAAIQAALDANAHVLVPPGTYRCDTMIEIEDRKCLELAANVTLHRFSASSANTDPVVWMKGQYSTLKGAGQATSTIASQNRCPEGVVRVGMASMSDVGTKDVTYNTIQDFNITGPVAFGQTTGDRDIGLHCQAPQIGDTWAVYFNNVHGLRITDVNTGIWLHGYANAWTIGHIQGFRLGNRILGGAFIHDNASLDNAIHDCFLHKSEGTPGILMEQLDNTSNGGQVHTTTHTSYRGMVFEPGEHPAWSSGLIVSANEVRRYDNGGVISFYEAQGAGTTGATPPTHLTGTVSDGGVDWLYLDSAPTPAIVATDGTVTQSFFEIRDNTFGGSTLDGAFTDRNWLFTGSGATGSTNGFRDFVAGSGLQTRQLVDQNDGVFFDETYWSIANLADATSAGAVYEVATIDFTGNNESMVVDLNFAVAGFTGVAADAGGKVSYFIKKDEAGNLTANVLSANFNGTEGNGFSNDFIPLKPYIASGTGTQAKLMMRSYNNGTGTASHEVHIFARINRSNTKSTSTFTPTTSATTFGGTAPDPVISNTRGRELSDQRDKVFAEERYHSIRSMAENTYYDAVQVEFTANQQSATVEINFSAGSGSAVAANGGGVVVYTLRKSPAGVVTATARLARFESGSITPCEPQIVGDVVHLPFLTFNNGTSTTVQRLHMKTVVNTSNGTDVIIPTFVETATTSPTTSAALSNTL